MALKDNLQVMVVDDMSVSRGLLVSALENIGVKHVTYEFDGKAALSTLTARPVHLVISDYHMPEMDGLTLLRKLRGNKPTSRIGFILVTGSSDKQVLANGKKFGMNNYLRKPFDNMGVKRCIEAVVGPLG